jgi:hypothetical protein
MDLKKKCHRSKLSANYEAKNKKRGVKIPLDFRLEFLIHHVIGKTHGIPTTGIRLKFNVYPYCQIKGFYAT